MRYCSNDIYLDEQTDERGGLTALKHNAFAKIVLLHGVILPITYS